MEIELENKLYRDITQIIRDNKDEFLWEPCECGCPGKSTARSKAAVSIIKILKALDD